MPVSREQWTSKYSRQVHPALAAVEQAGELDAVSRRRDQYVRIWAFDAPLQGR